MVRLPPRSTLERSPAASGVYKRQALKSAVLAMQERDGASPYVGSCPPAGPWSDVGGRIYQTAVGVLGPDVMMEIFVSDNGTWTIISTDTGGQSCVISAGEGWDSTFLASLPQA